MRLIVAGVRGDARVRDVVEESFEGHEKWDVPLPTMTMRPLGVKRLSAGACMFPGEPNRPRHAGERGTHTRGDATGVVAHKSEVELEQILQRRVRKSAARINH